MGLRRDDWGDSASETSVAPTVLTVGFGATQPLRAGLTCDAPTALTRVLRVGVEAPAGRGIGHDGVPWQVRRRMPIAELLSLVARRGIFRLSPSLPRSRGSSPSLAPMLSVV